MEARSCFVSRWRTKSRWKESQQEEGSIQDLTDTEDEGVELKVEEVPVQESE